MKQIHFFNTNFYFRHYFIGSFRELPVLPWLTEEKQIMQLLHLRFYCQRQLQPSYQLTNLAALWRPLPVFPFTFYNLEACFQEDTVKLPKTSIAFLFHKKEEPNLQKKLYQILHFIFFLQVRNWLYLCHLTVSETPIAVTHTSSPKEWKEHLKNKETCTELELEKLAGNPGSSPIEKKQWSVEKTPFFYITVCKELTMCP